jgi:hypothetical protein
MNALDTTLGVEAAHEVRMSRLPAALNEMGRPAASGAALRTADWLNLAAAPTFAVMALLTAVPGDGPLDALCAAARGASPLGGMTVMYLLMSAFHAAPWLRLICARRVCR